MCLPSPERHLLATTWQVKVAAASSPQTLVKKCLFCVHDSTRSYNDSVDVASSDSSTNETSRQKKNKHSKTQTDCIVFILNLGR